MFPQCEIAFSLQEFLKLVPGILALPLTLYLGYRKIGLSISYFATWTMKAESANQISNVVLTNNKDRAITIFELWGVYDEHIKFSIQKFDPPVVLKAHETLSLDVAPYSALVHSGSIWEFPTDLSWKLHMYASTSTKTVKCKLSGQSGFASIEGAQHYVEAGKITHRFNEIVYDKKKVSFAIVYFEKGGQRKTIFVTTGGFLHDSEDLGFNHIPKHNLRSKELVAAYIRQQCPELKFEVCLLPTY